MTFTETPKACITLNVKCDTGAPDTCGSYSITNGSFKINGNTLNACNLYSNDYTIKVTPLSSHTSSWNMQTITLNGIDQTLDVILTENKYCAKLDVSCPEGGANVCGSYTITGNGKTYGMDTNSNNVSNCALRNGNYNLTVTPIKPYQADKTELSFTIANNDWNGNVNFKKIVKNCKTDGYFEAGGKKYTCPFNPPAVSLNDCYVMKYNGVVSACWYDNDYWLGAVKQCGGKNNLPSRQDLANIASVIYNTEIGPNTGGAEYTSGYSVENMRALGLPETTFYLWTNEENYSIYVSSRDFYPTYTGMQSGRQRNLNTMMSVCVIN